LELSTYSSLLYGLTSGRRNSVRRLEVVITFVRRLFSGFLI
jgi:hypothetical protein